MILLVWLHLLAATTWVGGMLFLSFVLVPVFKAQAQEGELRLLFVALARRFRVVVWVSIALLISTGVPLIQLKTNSLLGPASWPALLKVKLGLVALLLALTVTHDFWLGPRLARMARTPHPRRWRDDLVFQLGPWLVRGALVLALAVVIAAVALVRS